MNIPLKPGDAVLLKGGRGDATVVELGEKNNRAVIGYTNAAGDSRWCYANQIDQITRRIA